MSSRNAEVVDRLFLDTFAGRGWNAALSALAEWLGCCGITVAALQSRARGPLIVECGGPGAVLCREYVRDYLPGDDRLPRLFAHDDDVVPDSDLLSAAERRASPLHHELLARMDIDAVLLARLDLDDAVSGFAQFCRARAVGGFDAVTVARVRSVLPHLSTAMRLRRQLLSQHSPAAFKPVQATTEHRAAALFVLDERRNVVDLNPPARVLLEQHDVFRLRDGRLQACDSRNAVHLDLLLGRPNGDEAPHRGAPSQRVARLSCTCGSPLTVIARPTAANLPGCDSCSGACGGTVALLVVDSGERRQDSEQLLKAVYGLAPMQAGVAACIAEGRSLSEAAALLGISRNTAKTHLNGAFAKTLTRSQGELCALVNRQLALFDRAEAADPCCATC